MSILRVNMSSLTVKKEQVKADYEFLGGRALIAKILLDEVKPTCEPLGKHNKLIYATGLLGGSNVYSSGRISIGGKSPLTGGAKESNGGGVVGLKLGRLGYKGIIIEDLPLNNQRFLLYVSKKGLEILPAEEYWGLGVYEAVHKLRGKFGDVAVSCIGPAGEQCFFSAGISNTDTLGVPSRYSGRGGLGAVMGSKGIKALIVDDSGAEAKQPLQPEQFKVALHEYARLTLESQQVKVFAKYGTASLVEITNAVGGLPTRNFSTGVFEKAENISGETLYDLITARQGQTTHSCMPGCLIRCSNIYVDELGDEIVSPLEYETIALMGSNLDIDSLDVIAQLNYLCNDYGLDTIEAGAALGVAMASGFIPFGDAEGALNMVREIGKGSLIGRVLGMGAEIAGKVLGVSRRPTVKGQAISGYDPRGVKGTGVTYATSPMGADHTAGNTIRAQINHRSSEGQVRLSRKTQNTIPIYDNLGLCMFTSAALGAQLQLVCDLVNAQLGIEWDLDKLSKQASDTILWELEFNRKAGMTISHDRLPEFFCEEVNPANNSVFDISDEELDTVHT